MPRGRSRADWLVGMNLSRAYSLVYDEELSVGRVQTPTLAMMVDRELAIRSFVPEDYLEVVATFQARGNPSKDSIPGHLVPSASRRRATTRMRAGKQRRGCLPMARRRTRIVAARRAPARRRSNR